MLINNVISMSTGPGQKMPNQAARQAEAPDTSVRPPSESSGGAGSTQEIEKAVKEMNELIKPAATSIQFVMDQDTGRTIVKMIDTDTSQVVRQIPSEEVLAISKALDTLRGLTLDLEA